MESTTIYEDKLLNDILKIYLQSPCQGELWCNWFTRWAPTS